MDFITAFIDYLLHLDTNLMLLVARYGVFTYAILFGVIFAETGFVVTPFLPGDSLVFAAGAIASLDSLNLEAVIVVMFLAAVLGDTVNYWIGYFFGKKIVDNPKITFINQEHIDRTEQFYKKYGGKTIILARFVPIVRTFAPFVAGVGSMEYHRFIYYNIVGGALWIILFTVLGYIFGNVPFVKENFELAVFAIIAISLLPIVYEYIQHKRSQNVPGVSAKKLKQILRK